MLFAKNRVSVGSIYGETGTYRLDPNTPVEKLTIIVQGDNVYLDVSSEVPPAFATPADNEMEIFTGFNTRSFKEPVYGFRFRSRTSSTVTFVAQ